MWKCVPNACDGTFGPETNLIDEIAPGATGFVTIEAARTWTLLEFAV